MVHKQWKVQYSQSIVFAFIYFAAMPLNSSYRDLIIPKIHFVPFIFHSKTFTLDYDDDTASTLDLSRLAIIDANSDARYTYEKLREDVLRVCHVIIQ